MSRGLLIVTAKVAGRPISFGTAFCVDQHQMVTCSCCSLASLVLALWHRWSFAVKTTGVHEMIGLSHVLSAASMGSARD